MKRWSDQSDMPINPAALSPVDQTPVAPTGLRVALGAAALVAFAGSLVPLAVGWVLFASLGVGGLAEVLQHTGGLDASILEPAFWLATLWNGGTLIWALVRRLRLWSRGSGPSPHVPAVDLALTYLVLGAPLILIDLGGVDVPDLVTAVFLVGLIQLTVFLSPILALAVAVRLAWRLVAHAVSVANA